MWLSSFIISLCIYIYTCVWVCVCVCYTCHAPRYLGLCAQLQQAQQPERFLQCFFHADDSALGPQCRCLGPTVCHGVPMIFPLANGKVGSSCKALLNCGASRASCTKILEAKSFIKNASIYIIGIWWPLVDLAAGVTIADWAKEFDVQSPICVQKFEKGNKWMNIWMPWIYRWMDG